MSIKIKDIEIKELRDLAALRHRESVDASKLRGVYNFKISTAFSWKETPEGEHFWRTVSRGGIPEGYAIKLGLEEENPIITEVLDIIGIDYHLK
jgi:hypothetical protein